MTTPVKRKAGRPKGSGNGAQIGARLKPFNDKALDRIARKFATDKSAISPLEFLINTYLDDEMDIRRRLWAAKEAMPYLHRKVPDTVEHDHSGTVETTVNHRHLLEAKVLGTLHPVQIINAEVVNVEQEQLMDERSEPTSSSD